jgi:methylated-DNA-[protein]-cysteine S-methyltransferase
MRDEGLVRRTHKNPEPFPAANRVSPDLRNKKPIQGRPGIGAQIRSLNFPITPNQRLKSSDLCGWRRQAAARLMWARDIDVADAAARVENGNMETRTLSSARYRVIDTAIGTCGIAWNDAGLTRLQLPESDRGATERRLGKHAVGASGDAPAEIERLIAELQRYLSGQRIDFSPVVIDLTGTGSFERKVYAAARSVRWGETTSYGELARQVGAPLAARAVGQALGRNPVPIVIPCHRILAKGHRIGGFSAYGGKLTKERLLALEGVHIDTGALRLPGFD